MEQGCEQRPLEQVGEGLLPREKLFQDLLSTSASCCYFCFFSPYSSSTSFSSPFSQLSHTLAVLVLTL